MLVGSIRDEIVMVTCGNWRRDCGRLGDGGNGCHCGTSSSVCGREAVGIMHSHALMILQVVEWVDWHHPIGNNHSTLCWVRELPLEVSSPTNDAQLLLIKLEKKRARH